MIRLRFKIALAVTAILGVLVWLSGYRHGANHTLPRGPNPSTVLPVNVTERITVDPEHHTISIQTPTGIHTETLPDRKSTIDLDKNGKLKVTSSQFGLEHHVFFGLGMSDNLRLTAGVDGVYYKKLDLGIGLGMQIGEHSPIVLAKLSYNVLGNMQLGVMYGSNKSLGAILSVRVF